MQNLVKQIFREVSRSLFEKHKLLFTFLVAVTIIQLQGQFDSNEWNTILTGISDVTPIDEPNPDDQYFLPSTWEAILHLNNVTVFKGIVDHIKENLDLWKQYCKDIEYEELPNPYIMELTPIQKLLIYKTLRADLFLKMLGDFISEVLGESFTQPQIFTIDDSFKESNTPYSPLIFILSPGDDPQDNLKKFAHEKSCILSMISLGKGQGEYAKKTIKECMQAGTWILLQNCHLAISWLKDLEELVENLPEDSHAKRLHENFRLWLTSASTNAFPTSLLQVFLLKKDLINIMFRMA